MTRGTLVVDMPEAEYHARPELSATGVKRLTKSAATFDWWRRNPEPGKRSFDVGSAAHAKILGVGSGIIAYPEEHLTPSGNVSTKAATLAWAEEQRALGLIPVSPDDVAAVDRMAEAVLAHPDARLVLEQPGDSEVSVFNTDPETGVELRARFDRLPHDTGRRRIAGDVKTTKDAHPLHFPREIARYRYDVQDAHYRHTYEPEGDPDLEFWFIAVETAAPHHVSVGPLNDDFVHTGRVDAAKARRLFAECTASGIWPGYPARATLFRPPVFHINDFQDSEEE